jgi:MoaA/NifB/PqqE/SkfB family radical SAM enzyme
MIRFRHLKLASRFFFNRFRKLHPFEIQAYVTTVCNQKCIYCLCPDAKKETMSTEQWKDIIQRLGSLGSLRFKIQGGEPTLRKDFRELCKAAREAGMFTATVSNGILIESRPELLDYLDELVLSIDSPHEDVNDSIRGPGALKASLKAMDLALEKGIRTFVNMVIVRQNQSDIDDMLKLCEEKGVMLNAQAAMFDRKYFVDKNIDFALSNDEIRNLQSHLAELKRQGRGLLFSAWAYQKAADWQNYDTYTIPSKGNSSCMAGKDYFHIEPDGNVHPCGHLGAEFTPKNIIQDGFDEAFQHAKIHNCGDCWLPFMNERKATFGLKPFAIRELFGRD